MREFVVALLCVAALFQAGCSSHEPRFEATAPPAPQRGPSVELIDATGRLIHVSSARLSQLSPEALAALASAAAITFRSRGAPRARSLTRRYADALLEARVPVGEDLTAFFSEARPGRPDPGMTAAAGLAMLDAWLATRDRRYAEAAKDAIASVTAEELGWTEAGSEAAVREPDVPRGRSNSLTANAFLLLGRADRELKTETRARATRLLRTLDESQAAVGRWYATIGPPRLPMRLDQWATTLYALSSSQRRLARGIAGAGVPAMYDGVFDENGRVRDNPLTRENPSGVALALGVLTRADDRTFADRAFTRILRRLRADGTVDLAAPGDLTAQAQFALSFARRQAMLSAQK